jgi:hypothetical protein
LQTLSERSKTRHKFRVSFQTVCQYANAAPLFRLLGARRNRPNGCRTTEK